MSTYLYLVCVAHDPPLRADCESGQHLYDLPQIRADIRNRDEIVKAMELGMEPDSGPLHFRRATARFLSEHPRCPLAIYDEYGERHALTGEPLTQHEGADQ